MIEDSITYLSRGDNWANIEIIGGGLLALSGIISFVAIITVFTIFFSFLALFIYPIAIAIALPVGGYYIRVFRSTVRGDDEPPSFSEWSELFKDGALAFIISIIYMIVPTITLSIFFVVFGLFSASLVNFDQPPTDPSTAVSDIAAGLGLGTLFTFVLAWVVWLVFSYFLTIALINFARKEDFGGAFDFSTIWSVAATSDFLVGWLIGFIIFGSFAWVINWVVLANIPIIGFFLLVPLVMPFITFYITVSSNRLFATSFVKALGNSP